MCPKGLLLRNGIEVASPRRLSRQTVRNRCNLIFILTPNGTELECWAVVVTQRTLVNVEWER
jgi:hypothetical protein